MHSTLKIDPHTLNVFSELKKRRLYVGQLIYDPAQDVYQFTYDTRYMNSKSALSLGPGLEFLHSVHTSPQGKLFDAFVDRIPEKKNPAYPDYCYSQGISPDEANPILLLGTIGKRGPSCFVFEKVYQTTFTPQNIVKFREALNLTQYDLAMALGITKVTLQRIETGLSHDMNTLRLLQIYFTFPEVALWQLQQTGANVHYTAHARLVKHFVSS